jgi:hypothetical protein
MWSTTLLFQCYSRPISDTEDGSISGIVPRIPHIDAGGQNHPDVLRETKRRFPSTLN